MILDKTFDLLEIFLTHQGEHTASELSKYSSFNLSTTNRIISKLIKRGYLKKSLIRGKYALGTKFLDFSGTIKKQLSLLNVALPFMSKLSREIDESIILALWDGVHAVHITTVAPTLALRVIPEEGSRFPLYATSIGKAILAEMTDNEIEAYFKYTQFESKTHNTITNINDLKAHLIIVKREGVAFDDEEQGNGVRGLAAVIKNGEGKIIGSLGVVGPSTRLNRSKMREIAPKVKDSASEISKYLGYKV